MLALISALKSDSEKKQYFNKLDAAQKAEVLRSLQDLTSLLQNSDASTSSNSTQSHSSTQKSRTGSFERTTKETSITCSVNLDGTGASSISTGIGFLDHMFTALSKHSLIDITLQCKGDLDVDDHHTAEDCAIALGIAFDLALGPSKTGIQRYGSAYAPLDEALSRAVVDISGRPSANIKMNFVRETVGKISTEMLTHVLQSFAISSKITLHVTVIEGENDHHKAEASFKALALALKQAVSIDQRRKDDVPSTKGVLQN